MVKKNKEDDDNHGWEKVEKSGRSGRVRDYSNRHQQNSCGDCNQQQPQQQRPASLRRNSNRGSSRGLSSRLDNTGDSRFQKRVARSSSTGNNGHSSDVDCSRDFRSSNNNGNKRNQRDRDRRKDTSHASSFDVTKSKVMAGRTENSRAAALQQQPRSGRKHVDAYLSCKAVNSDVISAVIDDKANICESLQKTPSSSTCQKKSSVSNSNMNEISKQSKPINNSSRTTFADAAAASLVKKMSASGSIVSQSLADKLKSALPTKSVHISSSMTTASTITSSAIADQSTATTHPETLSGVSNTTDDTEDEVDCAIVSVDQNNPCLERHGITSSSSLLISCSKNVLRGKKEGTIARAATDKVPESVATSATLPVHLEETEENHHEDGELSIPMMLSGPCAGVEATDSAASSVASSLEAPTNHVPVNSSVPAANPEEDVGYHLLDVCDRLSRDMSAFMGRRAVALAAKRRERSFLLSSLQETVAQIWPARCHVEMYGSCATQLDLPSSDLDVVVCGLPPPKPPKHKKKYSTATGNNGASIGNGFDYNYHITTGAGARIMRLASELERKPWAVQIKPIPTATVPVIKMLADPSRIPGAAAARITQPVVAGNEQWIADEYGVPVMMNPQYHQINNSGHNQPPPGGDVHPSNLLSNNAAVEALKGGISAGHNKGAISSMAHPTASTILGTQGHSHHHWRGADVMNGLISVDITFEGPEHAGLESTNFAARVVQDACNETSLPPEATPTVQLIMVLKELLAQRRLNEPFSGGLSSYGVLLMACAITRESKAIKAELAAAAERHRQDGIKASNNNKESSESTGLPSNPNEKGRNKKTDKPEIVAVTTKESDSFAVSTSSDINDNGTGSVPSSSTTSWAMIAKQEKRPNTAEISPSVTTFKSDVSDCSSSSENDCNVTEKNATDSKEHRIKNSSTTAQNELVPCVLGNTSPSIPSLSSTYPSYFAKHQGSNDVLEVLCSGEPTSGKLLMHFLLFYGKYFDAPSMSIDINSSSGPFVSRMQGGSIDPITGVYTVDPIVVYDLDPEKARNVTRSCFMWSTIRWVFAQCFATLTHTLETGHHHNNRLSSSVSSNCGHSNPQQQKKQQKNLEQILRSNSSSSDPSTCLLQGQPSLLELLMSY